MVSFLSFYFFHSIHTVVNLYLFCFISLPRYLSILFIFLFNQFIRFIDFQYCTFSVSSISALYYFLLSNYFSFNLLSFSFPKIGGQAIDFIKFFLQFFLPVLGVLLCTGLGFPLVVASRGYSLVVVHGPHCGGSSCCGAQALGTWASVVAAHRLSN